MIGDSDIELIDKYLEGLLSEQELIVFNKRMEDDLQFKEEVELQRLTILAIQKKGREELKKTIKKISGEYHFKTKRILYSLLAAASIITLFTIGLYYFLFQPNEKLLYGNQNLSDSIIYKNEPKRNLFDKLSDLPADSFQPTIENKKPNEISITKAIDQGILKLRISGSYDPRMFYEVVDGDGMYFGKCMAISLESLIDSFVLLKLDRGTLLIPTDDSVQTMIVTHDALFPLYPNSSYSTRFYAMCTQFHDKAPSIFVPFRIGEIADSNLIKLTKQIDDSYMQNMIGQHALWAYTDKVSFEELKKYGADSLSIIKTRALLNSVNLVTMINSERNLKQKNSINALIINRYIAYGSIGLIVFLSLTTLILIIRRKKK